MIAIWDEVLLKIRVSFDGLITKNEVLSESIYRIEAHLDVVIEVIDIQSSVSFEFCIDEELLEFW